jgi:hypothetical protein
MAIMAIKRIMSLRACWLSRASILLARIETKGEAIPSLNGSLLRRFSARNDIKKLFMAPL